MPIPPRRLAAAPLAFALFAGSIAAPAVAEAPLARAVEPAGTASFDDVPAGHRFANAINWLVTQGITTGRTPTAFDPNGPVTRGQMAAFLWRYQSSVPPRTTVRFVDLTADAWNADAVSYLAETGITQGVTPDRYGGSEPVTRQQMATFLWRLSGRPPTDSPAGFADVPAGSTHADAIGWLAQSGVTTGVTVDRYDPTGTVTRGQMAAFLWRLAGEPDPALPGLNRLGTDVEVIDPDKVTARSFDDQTGDATFRYMGELPDVGSLLYIPPATPFPHGTWGEVTTTGPDRLVSLTRTPLDTIWPELDLYMALVPDLGVDTASVVGDWGGFPLTCSVNSAQVELAARFSSDPDGEFHRGNIRLRTRGTDALIVRAEVELALEVAVTGRALPDSVSCTVSVPGLIRLRAWAPTFPVIVTEVSPDLSLSLTVSQAGILAPDLFSWERTYTLEIGTELTGRGPDGHIGWSTDTSSADGGGTSDALAVSISVEPGLEVVVLASGVAGVGLSANVSIAYQRSSECDPALLANGWRWIDFSSNGALFGRMQLFTSKASVTWEPLHRTFGPYFPFSIDGPNTVGRHCGNDPDPMPDPGPDPMPDPDPDPTPTPEPPSAAAGQPHWVNGALVIDRTLLAVDELSGSSRVLALSNNDRYIAFYSQLDIDTDTPSLGADNQYLYDLATDTIRPIGNYDVLAVRDDGTVVASNADRAVLLIDPFSGTQQVLYDPADEPQWYDIPSLHEPKVAPDGRTAFREQLGNWEPVGDGRSERHGSFEVFDLDSGSRLAGLEWTDDSVDNTTFVGNSRFSADGRTFVYHISRGPHDELSSELWKLDVASDTHTLLLDSTDAPDGYESLPGVAFVANGGNRGVLTSLDGVFLYDVEAASGVLQVSDGGLSDYAFSADGSTLAVEAWDDAAGSSQLLVTDVEGLMAGDLAWTNVSERFNSRWPAASAGKASGLVNPITSTGSHLLTDSLWLGPDKYQPVRIGYLPLD